MADNTTLNGIFVGGGDVINTDDIGGVKMPRSKIVLGNDGVNDGDVSLTNPLPAKITSLPSVVVSSLPPVTASASAPLPVLLSSITEGAEDSTDSHRLLERILWEARITNFYLAKLVTSAGCVTSESELPSLEER